ncbi:hypothetical protein [Burkholderia sp. Ac-20353]|uniref:hypothetical protein n=1 Tax=Burkholderia sp. Ac-20353 TaxID=2703894 RepID=UPI00197BC37E|nr:hypothetical protein [Burkholderia sp. Ac-20353]MBN3788303.1 hypothetical protein [Burkholderia sp. Ac-20353]
MMNRLWIAALLVVPTMSLAQGIPENCRAPMANFVELSAIPKMLHLPSDGPKILGIVPTGNSHAREIGNGRYRIDCMISVSWDDGHVDENYHFSTWEKPGGGYGGSYSSGRAASANWSVSERQTNPPSVEQRVAAAVTAHSSDSMICNPSRDRYACGAPAVDIGKLAASLLATAGTQAAWTNSGGLPVKWVKQSDIPSRDGILVFANGALGDIRIAPKSGGLTQIGISTNDCTSADSSVCAGDIRESLERAGVTVQRVCYGDSGPQYQVSGPHGAPAVITWRVSGPDMVRMRAATTYMEIFPGMTAEQDATAVHGCKEDTAM